MNPVHRALRDRTGEAHDRLDALFAGFGLSHRESYVRFLSAHADAVFPLEHALDAAGAERLLPDWPSRRRGVFLDLDLAELDADPPIPSAMLLETDDATLLGTLYVLEGSRLGGRFLARRLPPDFPRRYLDTDQPRGNWPFLLERLASLLYEVPDLDKAVAAALDTFARFEASGREWLAKG